jgi:DNA-binding NarL/FixJ family response regulator
MHYQSLEREDVHWKLPTERGPGLKPIKILLVDDHQLVRAGIRTLLEKLPDVEVTGEVTGGGEALQVIRERPPDVVLMDIGTPEVSRLDETARIAAEFPGVRVVVLSMYTDQEYVRKAVEAGAAGYLLKGSAASELANAISSLARGEKYFTPLASREILEARPGQSDDRRLIERLTSRQSEILQLIAQGHNTKEIAQDLNISVKTVETHRARLMGRLGIYDVPGLVRFAIRIGLVSLDE